MEIDLKKTAIQAATAAFSQPDSGGSSLPSSVSVQQDDPAAPVVIREGQVSKTYSLAYPVTAPDGAQVTEFRLRRLKAKEMKHVDPERKDGQFGAVLKFVAIMSGVPDMVMDELDAADVIGLVAEAAPFLGSGTGATPSP
jgi:hypothetical protein